MELKISKIQWKKVLAFALTLCMIISMVQLPVNAEETTKTVSAPKHLNVYDLREYEETATFFDAAADRDAIGVQTVEENKTYTVDPTTGYYDAKWFSFTPKEDGMYTFKANEEGKGTVAALLEKTSDGEYRELSYSEYYSEGSNWVNLFYIKSVLQKNKTYYLCAGYSERMSGDKEEYSFNVAKQETKELSSQPVQYIKDSDSTYTFTAPKTGYYELKYTWKGTDKQNSWVNAKFDWNCGNKKVEGISGSSSDSEQLYYVSCEEGKTYYLWQTYFKVRGESVDAEISISSKEDVQQITSSNAGKVTSEINQPYRTNSKLFEVKLDESGYYSLNLDWGNAEAEKDSIRGNAQICNADGGQIDYINLDSDSTKKIYLRKGEVYYLILSDIRFYNKKEDRYKEYTASVTFVKDSEDIQEITTSKPGEFRGTDNNKLFKFTAESTGYYSVQVDKPCGFSNIRILGPGEMGAGLYSEYYENIYFEKGQSCDIIVEYGGGDDDLFKIEISQVPIQNIDYSKGGKLSTNIKPHKNENKIFKFTAQYTGRHVLKYSWDNVDAKLWYVYPTIKENTTTSKKCKNIKEEKTNAYQFVYLKKGNTYYFYITSEDVAFKSRTTKKLMYDSVDISFDIAYYNGKTDIDTIKNGKPMIPGEDNGNTDKPDNGNTDKPDNGNTNKPDNSTETPNTNKPNKPAQIKVSKIKISAPSNKIAAGKKVKLTAAVAPANASNKAVKWTTSNKKVAVVSKSGVVTVNKKAGGKSVVITAIAADGKGARATYKITVMKDAVKKVTITGKNVVKAGKKLKLKAKVVAGKKANKKLVWSTSNKKFATVNQNGVVTAKKAGKGKKVKITARATDGSNKKKVFTIKIK